LHAFGFFFLQLVSLIGGAIYVSWLVDTDNERALFVAIYAITMPLLISVIFFRICNRKETTHTSQVNHRLGAFIAVCLTVVAVIINTIILFSARLGLIQSRDIACRVTVETAGKLLVMQTQSAATHNSGMYPKSLKEIAQTQST